MSGSWLRNLQNQGGKKEQKEKIKAGEEETAKEDAPIPLVTLVNNILHPIFSNVEVYINIQQIYNSNGLYARKFYTSRRNQFIYKKTSNNASVRRIAIAMNKNSAFTGSYTENPFWYQQFDLRQISILRVSQPFVFFEDAGKCRQYVTTIKAMNFQEDIPSILNDKFKCHFVLVLNARCYWKF